MKQLIVQRIENGYLVHVQVIGAIQIFPITHYAKDMNALLALVERLIEGRVEIGG